MWFRRKSKRPDRPLIFVCSPYRGDMETNTQNARQYCRLVMEQGGIPFAPHLLFTQFLDDAIPKERERGLRMGTQMLGLCDELWRAVRGDAHGDRTGRAAGNPCAPSVRSGRRGK